MPLPDVPMFHVVVKLVVPVDGARAGAVVDRPAQRLRSRRRPGDARRVSVGVIVCVTGVKPVIRGPRPPVGLTTSVVCVNVRGLAAGLVPGDREGRAAEVLAVGVAGGAGGAGVQTSAGGDAASLSAGSSNVHDVADSVNVTPRRSIVHGVPEPRPLRLQPRLDERAGHVLVATARGRPRRARARGSSR